MLAIEVRQLSKRYRYGSIGSGSFRRDFQSFVAKVRKREDPNSTVIEDGNETPVLLNKSEFLALNNVSFDVKEGDILGIVGRNGAGKSTLLKIISRITAPTEGTVKIRGRVVSLLEVGTGFHPELTGRENVYLSGMLQGMTRKEISAKMEEIVDFAEIEKFIDTPVKRYSSGMYVRLAFSVAAHLQAEILILDEILAVGDTKFQRKCQSKMIDVGGQGRTILYVSHNLNSVLALCNTAIYLQQGRMLEFGKAAMVVNNYLRAFSDSGADFQLQTANGSLTITRIRLTDAKGKPKHIFGLYSPMNVEIHYEAAENLGKLAFSIGVAGTTGVLFMGSMLYDNQKFQIRRGKGKLTCKFAKLPLVPGQNYSLFLNVRAQDNETNLIPTSDIGSFEIEGNLRTIGYVGPLARQTSRVSAPMLIQYSWAFEADS